VVDETRDISINVRATRAIRELTRVGITLDDIGQATGKSDAELRRIDRTLARASASSRAVARSLTQLKAEVRGMSKDMTASANTIRALESRLLTSNRRLEEWKRKALDLRAANKTLTKDNTQLAASLNTVNNRLDRVNNQLRETRTGARGAGAAMENLDKNFQINATRYALYDVARTFTVISGAATLALTSTLRTGIEFERNFANVVRTSQLTGGAIALLREQFLDLQSSIPVTSEELTRIGTLAAQMGIAAEDVAHFTEVTAKFAAASGISADEAATALARISQLLPEDVAGNYERLASAILKTGVNAIATEQQIVRGTTQIASIGKVAGLSAEEIVALSSAMSSLGMSPELQRSVITSSFTRILTAVRGSTDAAEKFGAILGLTGREFQDAWEGDGYNTYRRLLAAIAESPNAIGTLQELRLSSQRLTPNLLKLGQAYELLGETQRDTHEGWTEEAELQRQYQVIMDTTAAKLQVLQQAFEAFIVVLSEGGVDIVGGLADGFTTIIKLLTDLARHPVIGTIFTMITGLTGVLAVVTALMAAVALSGASYLGFHWVLQQVNAQMLAGQGLLGQLKVRLDSITASSTLAAGAVNRLAAAGRTLYASLGKITLIIAAFSAALTVSKQLNEQRRAVQGLSNDVDTLKGELTSGGTNLWAGFFGSAGASFEDIPDSISEFGVQMDRAMGMFAFDSGPWGAIQQLDETLADMVNNGKGREAAAMYRELEESWIASGKSADTFKIAFVDTDAALQMHSELVGATASEYEDYYEGVEASATAEERHAVALAGMADSLGLVVDGFTDAEDALQNFRNALSGGMGQFFNIGDLLEDAYGTDEGQGGGIARLQKDLDANLKAAAEWADGLAQLTIRGASSIAQAFAAEGPASRKAVLDALKLGPEQLAQLENSMANAAFFASEAYAAAFQQENAILADVYKKMLGLDPAQALTAVEEVRTALRESGGFLDATTLAALENKFGFELRADLVPNIDPDTLRTAQDLLNNGSVGTLQLPIEVDVPRLGETINTAIPIWQVQLDGQSLTIPVDPNTEEGIKVIQEWRENEYNDELIVGADADVYAANETLRKWREQNRTIYINAVVTGTGTPLLPSPVTRAKGGGIGIPGYAGGTSRPLRGPGTTTSDSILARLSKGEWVHNARAVKFYGAKMMDDINRMRFPKFASGGSPWFNSSSGTGAATVVNATVNQYYPTTRDPIKKLKSDAESVIAGIWT
jgi:TP901 family phage tail tape measure protein